MKDAARRNDDDWPFSSLMDAICSNAAKMSVIKHGISPQDSQASKDCPLISNVLQSSSHFKSVCLEKLTDVAEGGIVGFASAI